jgi:14-3-3 protein epsilon
MNMTQDEYEKLLYQAKISVEAGRSEETLDYMEKIIKNKNKDLTEEERNLVSVASKNCVSSKRAAWRSIYGIEVREKANNSKYEHLVSELKKKLEKELFAACNRMLGFIDLYLLKNSSSVESKVFYLKLKGDYFRYLAEFNHESNHPEIAQNSLNAYKQASEAAAELKCNNPIKLGLALNYSVFYYEVLDNPLEAINIANSAFNEGITNLENIVEHQYKDATNILQLLKENINMWTADMAEEQGEGNDM